MWRPLRWSSTWLIAALEYFVWYSKMRWITVGIFCKTEDQRGGLPKYSTASYVLVHCIYYYLLMVNPQIRISGRKNGGNCNSKNFNFHFTERHSYAEHQKVARLIVVLCNLPRSCDYLMKLVETLSPRDYSSEGIARSKHRVWRKNTGWSLVRSFSEKLTPCIIQCFIRGDRHELLAWFSCTRFVAG